MGSITFQVIGDGTVGTKTKTYAVTDADINRLVAWAKANFGQATVAPALLAWADSLMSETKERVLNAEQTAAILALTPTPFNAT